MNVQEAKRDVGKERMHLFAMLARCGQEVWVLVSECVLGKKCGTGVCYL